jgi:hypothetical protein
MFHVPEPYRITAGALGSDASFGNNGAFRVPLGTRYFTVIASDLGDWEHVSVSTPSRPPTWDEMCQIKALFWDAEDAVMQLHPPQSTYVNNHPFCLHLWRPVEATLPLPPKILV